MEHTNLVTWISLHLNDRAETLTKKIIVGIFVLPALLPGFI